MSASNILANIADHLTSFATSTQGHFDKTITVANDHVNEAVGQLQSSIESLDEKLVNLEEVVTQIDKMYRTIKR